MLVKPGKPSQRLSVKWHQKILANYGTHSPNRKSCNGGFRQVMRMVLDLPMRHPLMPWHLAIRMQTTAIHVDDSIMADSFAKIQEWILGLTKYSSPRRQASSIAQSTKTRMLVRQERLAHFLEVITSPHIIQDLPFGEKLVSLSNKEVIKIPSVVRNMVPERIV